MKFVFQQISNRRYLDLREGEDAEGKALTYTTQAQQRKNHARGYEAPKNPTHPELKVDTKEGRKEDRL